MKKVCLVADFEEITIEVPGSILDSVNLDSQLWTFYCFLNIKEIKGKVKQR